MCVLHCGWKHPEHRMTEARSVLTHPYSHSKLCYLCDDLLECMRVLVVLQMEALRAQNDREAKAFEEELKELKSCQGADKALLQVTLSLRNSSAVCAPACYVATCFCYDWQHLRRKWRSSHHVRGADKALLQDRLCVSCARDYMCECVCVGACACVTACVRPGASRPPHICAADTSNSTPTHGAHICA